MSNRAVNCRSCGAPIVFLDTRSGKAMPVDADTVDGTDHLFEPDRHRSHFATCRNAARHRRRRQPPAPAREWWHD